MRRKSYWSRSVGLLGGTATFDVSKLADSDSAYGPSFMTISNIFSKQAGFGVLWYNFAVPSDAEVSETGDPVP